MGVKWFARFSSCFLMLLIFAVFANCQSENLDSDSTSNPVESAKSFLDFEEFKALQKDNGDLKKVVEKLAQDFQLLQAEVNKLKNEGSEWIMEPLRGPPGEKGERGEQGVAGERGEPGRNCVDEQKLDSEIAAPQPVTSCSNAMEILPSPRQTKQRIFPHENKKSTSVEALCDFETDGGGWTIIQRRSKGPRTEFSQTWNDYKNGFGSLDGNFWLGLDNIHALTKDGDQELRIQLENFEGEKGYAKYSSFSISDASDFYRLSISTFSGNATDSLSNPSVGSVSNGMRFSTKDKDNDNYPGNCAVARGGGGWWFNQCGLSNLNGLYLEEGATTKGFKGIYWSSWREDQSFAKSEMKIRKKK